MLRWAHERREAVGSRRRDGSDPGGRGRAPAGARAGGTHTFAVSLTISADRAARELKGEVVTDAPSEFCDSSTLRILRQAPGNDEVVARVRPYIGKWHLKSPVRIRGDRVYAEVLKYHLPSRPVICLGARSRTVTAP